MKLPARGLLFACLSIFVFSIKLHAQYPVSFNNFTIENGLSQNSVVAITQDKAHFLWFGTRQGLNRYDGYQFKIYRNNADYPQSLSSNEITQLFTDSKGSMWVGTVNGLNRYDQVQDLFIRISIGRRNKKKNPVIESIYEDRQHRLWIGSSQGLYLLTDDRKNTFSTFQFGRSKKPADRTIYAIYQDSKNNIWLGTTDGLLCMTEKDGRYTYKRFRSNPEQINSIGSNYVTAVNADRKGNLWVGTDNGLSLYHPETQTFTTYRHSDKDSTGIIHSDIRDITLDHKGLLWIGTQEGLSILDPISKKFRNYQHDTELRNSISHNSVHSIFQDVNQTMWVGTYFGGVNYCYPIATRFNVYRNSKLKPSISGNIISSIVEDEEQNLWIGTEGAGLSFIDRKHNRYSSYKTKPNDPNSISSNLIKIVIKDKTENGHLVIGTHHGGLNLFNPVTRQFRRVLNVKDSTGAIGTAEIVALNQDQYGTIWVASWNGLSILKKQSNGYPERTTKSVLDKYIKAENRGIQVLFRDRANQLWIGTTAGLFSYNFSSRKLSLYRKKATDPNKLKSDYINCLMETSDGQLCIGTYFGGLSLFNKQTNKFKTYDENDGLANNNVLGIVEDQKGILWISTANGLSKLDLKTGVFRNYTQVDGLAGNEFNFRSYLGSRNGEVFLGGLNGMTSFYPENIETNDDVVPIVFTGLKLFNQPVAVNGPDQLLKQQLMNTKDLTFRYDQNNFTIGFALLNYIKSDKNKYAYKLEGYDRDWNQVDHPSATYTNLPSGQYRFVVKGLNNDGIEGSNAATIGIHILPPIWASWWAYLIYLLISATILFLVIRYLFVRALLKRTENIQQMKLNFFTHVSHEIRTPLTLILGPLESLLKSTKDLPEVNSQVVPIKNNADRLMRLITELMDFRKNESGKLKLNVAPYHIIAFADEIFQSFSYLAGKHHIDYRFDHADQDIELYFDKAQMEKVLFNLLSNAFKFTKSKGSIRLSVAESTDSVIIQVRDNGIGIPYDSQAKLFSEFFQVNAQGSNHIGSGIGLALSKSIITAHQGNINIESTPASATQPGDTCFTVTLKKGKLHFSALDLKTFLDDGIEKSIYSAPLPVPDSKTTDLRVPQHQETILIVEDNDEIRQLLRNYIGNDYKIIESADGQEGWETAIELLPELIICDVMMPVMDGLELTKKLKMDERTSHIPIILLTAKSSHTHQMEGMEMGADSYVTKPFSMELLKLNVRNLLQSRANMRQKFSQQVSLQPQNITVSTIDHNFMAKVMQCIEERMADQDFGVPELSAQIGMSQPVLYKKIRAITDLSVNDFIKSIRLKKAAQLLLQKVYNISEVSYLVGFNDPKYFSREFKKQYGQTPRVYINLMEGGETEQ
ncbi:hybrid sensor histidine kinase/response regulator transcription factor [Pedobacter sp. MC2016-24]|uniref:hybrid sensor histidine kinase/response regulator transcription factor n=1 Tax=Pedobacter sp. MC2016-24 TaxID=2780090 RepID=UPI00187EDB05|nr:hybrid sensor histidine kinase/response regulator transcription factor [Pedobacter sp. MC2016-24]MBE9600462.1 response regulator [Pedobacter sp. MC2016-24]